MRRQTTSTVRATGVRIVEPVYHLDDAEFIGNASTAAGYVATAAASWLEPLWAQRVAENPFPTT